MKRLRRLSIPFETEDGGPVCVQARHPAVGDLTATFDREEITISVGDITHTHFTPALYESDGANDSIENAVSDAGEYVRGVIEDEWIVWANDAGFGGAYADDAPEKDIPGDARRYRWSGPID